MTLLDHSKEERNFNGIMHREFSRESSPLSMTKFSGLFSVTPCLRGENGFQRCIGIRMPLRSPKF